MNVSAFVSGRDVVVEGAVVVEVKDCVRERVDQRRWKEGGVCEVVVGFESIEGREDAEMSRKTKKNRENKSCY